MIVTDEIREYAREHYGAAMPDYLAAVGRIVLPGELCHAENADDGLDGLCVSVDQPGSDTLTLYAYAWGESVRVTPAKALRTGWDVIAMADAVRHGWLA